ncbi:hypothetical protein BKA65DRAFT_63774 [Rhexocercosporidium sp. MPI-PUGE-AT-0058]|nr:hypothetical protein BKA65DRAFT_63774 [Rhexocercosporidium sp. MPI-PUGE-AT-0058]
MVRAPAASPGTSGNPARSLAQTLIFGLINLPLLRALALPLSSPIARFEEEGTSPDDPQLWLYLGIALVLVLLGGVFAGLTIALMGQDEVYLEVIHDSGEENEKLHAGKVLRLLKRGKHWVLVTLLLSNVITNETLPIVLDRSLGGGCPAVVSSTALIVIFGEVIPQSICVRYGLQIGSYLSPVVLGLMYIMSPLAWPTAKLLDYLLGEDHGTIYKKAGLKTLVSLHMSLGKSPGERLNEDEVTIITAVLDLKAKSVRSIMTPIEDVFIMSSDTVLDEKMVDKILQAGYSRIPIHTPDNKKNFIGMLLVRMLITYDPEDAQRVCDLALATLPETAPDTSCLDIINFFQEGKSHMVVVSDSPGDQAGALGVVTLEDVIEELIGEEIVDESDVYIDNQRSVRRTLNAPVIIDPTEIAAIQAGEESQRKPIVATASDEDSSSKPDQNQTFAKPRRASTGFSQRAAKGIKHLGPSNLANKPSTTKYTSIKIKPGREHHHDGENGATTVAAEEREGGGDENTPLLGRGNGS